MFQWPSGVVCNGVDLHVFLPSGPGLAFSRGWGPLCSPPPPLLLRNGARKAFHISIDRY